ncbi:MAG: hypothetical protein KKB79_02140 [Nanoarchaeota archaeon]|nr:hypothetical protein [Nanoarchaeota archaeon]
MLDWMNQNPTLAIALYGAILSTIAIGWNIYNNLQDKPKIKVTTSFGFTAQGPETSDNMLFVTAINTGRRSIYLSSFGLRSGENNVLPVNRITGLPKELKGGESHTEWFEVKKLRGREYNYAWYKDQTGKTYKSKSINKKLNNYFDSEKTK